MASIRVRLDRELVEEIKELAGDDVDIAALLDEALRAVIVNLRRKANEERN